MKYFPIIKLILLFPLCFGVALSAAPMVDAKDSTISRPLFGDIKVDLSLSEPIAPKVRYLKSPYRLVLDFDELNFGELPLDFGDDVSGIEKVNFGETQTGARMVITFEDPHKMSSLVVSKTALDGQMGLRMIISKISEDDFLELASSLAYEGTDLGYSKIPSTQGDKDLPLIVIDPGHGGIDPGAVRDGVSEKLVTMNASRVIANILLKSNRYQVALTREKDVFVSLINRRRLGAHLQADLFLSIHADTVEVGDAQGSTIYLLSESATSENAEKFALFENRVDLFAGEYLEGDIGDLTNVLTDLAEKSTREKATRFAQILDTQLSNGADARHTRIESAAFAVLKAPDVPSILLELGFLSNKADRTSLQDEQWLERIGLKLMSAIDEIYYPSGTAIQNVNKEITDN